VRSAFPVLYHDGNLGHAVTLFEYDKGAGRFIYHDSWPEYSLLSKDYNAAGVDARREKGPDWSVTSAELEKVIFVAFVARNLWAEFMSEKYYLTYDEFTASDFWSFFHVKVVEQKPPDEKGRKLIALKTGGFQSEVDLNVTVNANNRLVEG